MLDDVGADLVRSRTPLLLQSGIAPDLSELGRSVERDPAHELGGDVVLRLAPRLPDPLVRVLPDLGGALCLRLHDRPEAPWQPFAVPGVQEDRVEHCAEDVVLTLVEGAVADPHRPGPGIAGQVVAGRLAQVT